MFVAATSMLFLFASLQQQDSLSQQQQQSSQRHLLQTDVEKNKKIEEARALLRTKLKSIAAASKLEMERKLKDQSERKGADVTYQRVSEAEQERREQEAKERLEEEKLAKEKEAELETKEQNTRIDMFRYLLRRDR